MRSRLDADSSAVADNVGLRCRMPRNESMSETVTVIVAHRLGKAEAVRRLKDGLASANGRLGSMIALDQQSWEGDTLRLRIRAVGQVATARVAVLDDSLRIEVELPWLLEKAAKWLLPALRKQATLLLEKK
jgi:hypothetical protein